MYEIDKKANTLRVVTHRAIKKGRQVYLDYEGFGAHYYLTYYGFVSISNIYDCLLIPLPEETSFSPLLEEVLKVLGFASDHTICLDITRFLNDKALAFFLLKDANPTHLKQCLNHYNTVVKENNNHWEVSDIRKCALGVYSDNTKELWDEVVDDLKGQLRSHLQSLLDGYSTSIGHDNVVSLQSYH